MRKRNWLTDWFVFDLDWKLWATPFIEVHFSSIMFWIGFGCGPFTIMFWPGSGGPLPDHEDDCNLCSPCKQCAGTGTTGVPHMMGPDWSQTCTACDGSGVASEPCEGCDGRGGNCACCHGAKVVKKDS